MAFREDIPYDKETPESDPAVLQDFWDTSKGLQKADGLETSAFLDEVIAGNVSGQYSVPDAVKTVKHQYESAADPDTEQYEADLAAANITELLTHNGFTFSPSMLQGIHEEIFTDVPLKGDRDTKWAGVYRTIDISKKEPILNGSSVYYSPPQFIERTLQIAFEDEHWHHYDLPFGKESIEHFSKFIASVWQVHPFMEGNTRAVSVFAIKYLRTMGFELDNTPFIENSDYFRDALVRACYLNLQKGINKELSFLNAFFENLLSEENHDLRGMNLHCKALFEG